MPFDSWIRKSLGRDMDDTMRDAQLSRAVGLNGQTVERLWSAYQAGAPGLYWSRVWALIHPDPLVPSPPGARVTEFHLAATARDPVDIA